MKYAKLLFILPIIAVFFFLRPVESAISSLTLPYILDTADTVRVSYVDSNNSTLKLKINEIKDTVNILNSGVIDSFTITLTGCSASTTGRAYYIKNGKIVTLNIPTLLCTSNSTSATLTGLPLAIYPYKAQTFAVDEIYDNNNSYPGKINLQTNGTILIYFKTVISTLGGTGFTAANQKGIGTAPTVTYFIP